MAVTRAWKIYGNYDGQLSDGIFENCRTGNIEELA